ncbi:flavin oxidoreductase/NADH oxidase [Leptolyngbya boryana NIES-2135]|jgi:2,4-dienoyl-CoA reductase-like NADH-dependent reductase (Old Yellow Enzyme family)|uniref:Flavin oxidoreductase/NADH oxidase n=1 Tax=Leptolyngbya boryana NIES-2135 TaxID=1973484 RepID=A0A1Z4JPR4_LEPBY|nr:MULTISPECIES: NADPH dehydrogenase NamA [Leptolyngbya]BAY58704.1 flavin oxidoreductase/NADH oxidase [Leptolyngbya boryana NIES-2135]MBD2370169.1 NADPH dehydrogenase NamA [Leptolyngbya sp. FACHB-161]MBD2376514.1 NADPH dehydrogenase NamA [Leptolyngbya sp. FACHB-238]MBD2400787.1 NADPH dehydrogenase NamA [Leptolyngbya sp. FACHB-239]MBD2407331.1 NADPH dehydrogenase NamA [Leptolyngbya sp. FACHB-402]
MSHLFEPLTLRDVTLRNRIVVSPMCQYSSIDGYANDWHWVHLTSRAVGGAGLVFTEAAAIEPQGRISPEDLGIWSDDQIEALAKIVTSIHNCGAVAGIQLAHAGRKASTAKPSEGGHAIDESQGGWRPIVSSSAVAFSPKHPTPEALTVEEIQQTTEAFAQAARRSVEAGFRVIEIHAAHGYLLHQFLSPLVNQRQDEYGGSFENRTRFLQEVVRAVREIVPERDSLWVRISATDWAEQGWDIEQSISLSDKIKSLGVDVIDCSSGGTIPGVKIPLSPGYQVPFAERIRREAKIQTGAVGLITSAELADYIIRAGQADVVLIGREFLRNPYWALQAAKELGQEKVYPVQYERAWI